MLSYRILDDRHPRVAIKVKELERIFGPIFPELDEVTLRIRMKKLRSAVAMYDHRSLRIDIDPRPFDPDKNGLLPSVIAHETMHAVQYIDRRIPHGERSCDIFMLARLPTNLYPKQRDFYVSVPQSVLSSSPERIRETAAKALELRRKGLRNYIVWFEAELKKSATV